MGEEQASVPFKQRAMPQECERVMRRRGGQLQNMQGEGERERGKRRDRQVSVSGSLSTDRVIAAAVK